MNLFDQWQSTKNFSDKSVDRETLEEIFEDTTKAPTAFNLQPYEFKVIDSEEAFEKIDSSLVSGNNWVLDADKIVILIGDERMDTNLDKALEDMIERGLTDEEGAEKFRERISSYPDRSDEFKHKWLTRNTMIPATFFMLSCIDHGVGCCPVKGFRSDKLSEQLDLKDWERPQLMIPIGYQEGDRERTWRREEEEIYEFI